MSFGSLGMWEILLIFLVILLTFGARRLPEIGSSLGKGIREFKGSLREIEGELKMPEDRQQLHGTRNLRADVPTVPPVTESVDLRSAPEAPAEAPPDATTSARE